MNTKHLSDGVLVYDRFYGARPSVLLLAPEKILLCCAAAVFGMLYILTEYAMPVSLPLMAGVTAAVTAVLSILFVFVKRRIAVPAILLVCGAVVWSELEPLWERLSYFVDGAMMLVDGRFLHPRPFLFHEAEQLSGANPLYADGAALGCAILCSLFALLTAACFAKRPRPLPVLTAFAALCAPMLISERLEFNIWLVPFAGCMAAAVAVGACFNGGLAVKGAPPNYRRAVTAEERSFRVNAKKADYPKRVRMHLVHYSKYFSVGVYCAVMFAVSLSCAALFFGKGSSLDYSKAYEFIMSIGDDAGITSSPFEEGPVSEYFTNPKKDSTTSLNVTSPGTGEQEIIRVSYEGNVPVYLRGDIGINFIGSAWTSPVNAEPFSWRESGLSERYRPCEGRVIHSLLEARGYPTEENISIAAVTIDYLCETSVVFLPPYTAEYSYYDNELFNVYGDFAVRVNEENGIVNTVQCTAVIPNYTDMDNSSSGADYLRTINKAFDSSLVTLSEIYTTVVPEMESNPNVIDDYGAFVEDTYLSVPEYLAAPLEEYLRSNGLGSLPEGVSESERRYAAAKEIADYLRSGYTYSLSAANDSDDPVMSFLNETKSGHCSLYASSMVLLLRQMGIPARYCTGFMVDPTKGSNVQVMRAKNLHAWCEVYLGELGWATFDPTSSSVYPSRTPERPEQTTTSATTSRSHATTQTTTVRESSATTSSSVSAPAPERADFTGYIIIGIAVILLIAAVSVCGWLLYRLRLKAQDRIRRLREASPAFAAAECYRLIIAVLGVYGVVPERGELPAVFYKRVDGLFGTKLCEDTELLESLAFGTPEVSDSDRSAVIHHLCLICRTAGKKHAPLRRIRLLRVLAEK